MNKNNNLHGGDFPLAVVGVGITAILIALAGKGQTMGGVDDLAI